MAKCYRHGDVSFHPISEAEYKELLDKAEGSTKKNLDSFVVALGEVTGHKHVMTMERPGTLDVTKLNESMDIFMLGVAAAMTHEEHHEIVMEPGFYVRKIEQEFDPFSEAARQSLD